MDYDTNDLRVVARTIDRRASFLIYRYLTHPWKDKRRSKEVWNFYMDFTYKQQGALRVVQNLLDLKEKRSDFINAYSLSVKGSKLLNFLEVILPFLQDEGKIKTINAMLEVVFWNEAYKKEPNKRNQNMRSRAFTKFKRVKLAEKKAESKNFL
jgi:hypothetical protein